jgi:hypothetical protein
MTEVWQKYVRKMAEVWQKYGRSMAEVWQKYGISMTEVRLPACHDYVFICWVPLGTG